MTDEHHHDCAKPGCHKQVLHGVLACRPHWYELPVDLRARINIGWRGRKEDEGDRHLAALAEAMRFWTGGR